MNLAPAFAACAAVAAVLPAQSSVARALDPSAFLIPIHTAAPDPALGEYGLWAAGPDFKASFHDGFAFYPWLGSEYPDNLPLRWRSTSISVGGEAWGESPSRDVRADWRYEYRHEGWVEAYDVSARGVEQSFVFPARPRRVTAVGPGSVEDVVIRGVIDTRLRADRRGPAHAPIVFADDHGHSLVEYGVAFAFDAAGRKIDVATSFDGSAIELRVPGAWLASAEFPVTVDPLTSRIVLFNGSSTVAMGDTDTATAARRSDPGSVLIVHSRSFTANDHDAYGMTVDSNLRNLAVVWTDTTASWSTPSPRCAFVAPSDDWVIVGPRTDASGSWLGVYWHDLHDRTLNSGRMIVPTKVNGFGRYAPDVGGQLDASYLPRALVVWEERSLADPSISDIRGAVLDGRTFGATFAVGLPAGTTRTRERPRVTSATSTAKPWMVAWQAKTRGSTTAEWKVRIAQVLDNGWQSSQWDIPANLATSGHKTRPLVEGDDESYLLAFTVGTTLSTRVEYQRLQVKLGVPPAFALQRTLAVGSGFGARPALEGLGYDTDTRSHWCLLHRKGDPMYATRVGQTGGITESGAVPSGVALHAGSVSFTPGNGSGSSLVLGRFVLVHAEVPSHWVSASYLTYPVAYHVAFGTGCYNGRLREWPRVARPLAGNGNYGMSAASLSPNAPAVFLLGAGVGATPIPGTPCSLYLTPNVLITAHATSTDQSGAADFALPIPDDPPFTGDLRFQCVWLDPALNPLGVGTTNGLLAPIR